MATYYTHSYAETVALGKKLGETLHTGKVIAFYGGLGVGKTAFVTGIAKGMHLQSAVSSPTFSIVHVYGKNSELCHFDMYRIESWDDLDSTGYFDYIDQGSVLCVEWSENIENALPEDSIKIEISRGKEEDDRVISITGLETDLI